jgi:hypothetical protein
MIKLNNNLYIMLSNFFMVHFNQNLQINLEEKTIEKR